MDILDGLDGWSLPDTLQLFLLRKTDHEWSDIAVQLKNRFGKKEKEKFYTEECCKERFAHVLSSPHPEHFLRNKGKKYSHKDLIQAWITFFERKAMLFNKLAAIEERRKKQQLLMVQFREKLVLFNKLFDDKCPFSNERILQLLEEARKEDSKCDPRLIEKGIAQILPKVRELDNLHLSKPDTYGCLRLVVNVSQLCEMNGCSEGTHKVLSENELDLQAVPSNTEEQGECKRIEQKTSTSPSVELTSELLSSSLDHQEIASSLEMDSTNNSELLLSKISQENQSVQEEANSILSDTSKSSLHNISNVSDVSGAKVNEESNKKAGETSIHIKTEPESVESGIIESNNYSAENNKNLATVRFGENSSTLQLSSNSSVASGVTRTTLPEIVENVKIETQEESNTIETENKLEKLSLGKRHLRNSKKDIVRECSPVNISCVSKNKQDADECILSGVLEAGSLLSDACNEGNGNVADTISVIRDQKTEITACIKRASSEGSSDANVSGDQKHSDEEAEKMNSKRRSDRLRTSEAPVEQTDFKSISLRRKASNATENQDDDFPIAAKKKRRLGTENSQGLSEASQMYVKRATDQNDGTEKRTVRSEAATVINKKDKGSRKESTKADSDEERTLGDILDKHRSPRKQASDMKSNRGKDEDALKRRVSNEDDNTKKLCELLSDAANNTSKKGRGSLRRSVTASQKGDGIQLKKQNERKHLKRRDTDDGSTEKKIFLMSAWRLVSSHRHAAIFAHPVSERDAQGYSATVKRRMDLSTLKRSVESGEVRDLAEFKRRLLLMFANAVMFNSTGHDVNVYAKEMALDTLTSLKDLEKDILYVRGGTHVTRRSAAFAAEEERRKTLNSSLTSIPKVAIVKDVSEDLSNTMASPSGSKGAPSKRSTSKLR
uniref:Bromo domain-containing protein n=1 Tax=Syphacia muris TaxID=451379 RepID=A0A0N5B0Z7_9BILA